jgi:ABC-type glycerol-3-phosphate transport system permease component
MTTLIITLAAVVLVLAVLSRIYALWKKVSLYIVLIVIGLIMILPFYMMFIMSTLSTAQIYSFPPRMYFGLNLMNNLAAMNRTINILRGFMNSLFVSISHVALVLLFCSMGGYAFAVHRFPFRRQLFSILLVTMMIPWTAGVVPWFVMMAKFGWINSYKALIIPGAANAFGIFWMRQYCLRNVPVSILDAARIDGCSEWTLFFRVVTPIILPAYASLGIMQFVGVWNDFIQPLMILRRKALHTLPVMLSSMISDRIRDVGAQMLANTCVVLPILIAFLIASKYFLSGLTAGAIKE